MKVFISWSGARSKLVAETLSDWLGKVIQAVEPWISIDIEKGVRWSAEIAERLEQSTVGIICLTQENVLAPWILFEAGALSKTKGAHVCTFLLDLQAADVEPPLGQFQHTGRDKDDVLALVKTINNVVARSNERALAENVLEAVFERFWPDLSARLEQVAKENVGKKPKPRTEREILEEVLEVVRNQDRRLTAMETYRGNMYEIGTVSLDQIGGAMQKGARAAGAARKALFGEDVNVASGSTNLGALLKAKLDPEDKKE